MDLAPFKEKIWFFPKTPPFIADFVTMPCRLHGFLATNVFAKQKTAVVIERLGKFQRIAQAVFTKDSAD